MNLINLVKEVINPFRIDVIKYPNSDLRRRIKLLEYYNISKILDVGANIGQYALLMRKIGFKGDIISFEPISFAYNELFNKTKNDKKWKAYNLAIGSEEGEGTINISGNVYSSSLLEIKPSHTSSAPESAYVNTERIKIETIDNLFEDLVNSGETVLLKIDVQGYEKNVLAGAKDSLKKIKGIQIEMSLEELYKDEMLFLDTINFLNELGFDLCSLENGFFNPKTGKLLQVDGIFFKEE